MNTTSAFPYIHISCPCAEDTPLALAERPQSPSKRPQSPTKQSSTQLVNNDDVFRSTPKNVKPPVIADSDDEGSEEDDNTFDPRNPRSAFSLFPIENLLYCEDCHQIRCPRCVQDEIVCWFCPSCLFEVPSSTVKSDGNRSGQLHHRLCAY